MALPAPSPTTTALVTGASSGIGEQIARQLAERGHGLVLVARRAPLLEALAQELRDAHGVRVEVVPTDLTDPAAIAGLVARVDDLGLTVDVLVNNAGFGIYGSFATSSLERELEQIDLLVSAVVRLNAAYLPQMLERDRGTIVNVSSTAGLQPLPGNGTYSASKVFVLHHSEALTEEVRGTGVTVTAVCPGPVRSGFQEASDPLFADQLPGFVWATPERVARDAIRAADRGRRMVIPGGLAVRAFFGLNRITPVAISLPISRRLMKGELARG
jgi:hypothetical protein